MIGWSGRIHVDWRILIGCKGVVQKLEATADVVATPSFVGMGLEIGTRVFGSVMDLVSELGLM